jgi:hypothetical protein
MKKTIYLKSTTPAIIEYNQEQILLENSHEYHSLDIEEDIILKYFPLTNSLDSIFVPKLVKLKYDCRPNKDIKITEYDQDCYEIEIVPTKISKLTQLEQKNININSNNYIVKLYSGEPSHITIVGDDCTFCHEINFALSSLQVDSKNGYLLIQATSQDKTYLLILDNNFVIQEEKLFNMLELKDQVLKGYLDLKDMAKHGSIISYDFSTKPYSTKQSAVYINNKPTTTNNTLLIPYAFLEAVKIKNYKLAHHYLSTTLSNKLKNQHLDNFFGDFVEIKQNIYTKTNFPVALIYGNNNDYYAKLFAFEIENNKIKNIIQA